MPENVDIESPAHRGVTFQLQVPESLNWHNADLVIQCFVVQKCKLWKLTFCQTLGSNLRKTSTWLIARHMSDHKKKAWITKQGVPKAHPCPALVLTHPHRQKSHIQTRLLLHIAFSNSSALQSCLCYIQQGRQDSWTSSFSEIPLLRKAVLLTCSTTNGLSTSLSYITAMQPCTTSNS